MNKIVEKLKNTTWYEPGRDRAIMDALAYIIEALEQPQTAGNEGGIMVAVLDWLHTGGLFQRNLTWLISQLEELKEGEPSTSNEIEFPDSVVREAVATTKQWDRDKFYDFFKWMVKTYPNGWVIDNISDAMIDVDRFLRISPNPSPSDEPIKEDQKPCGCYRQGNMFISCEGCYQKVHEGEPIKEDVDVTLEVAYQAFIAAKYEDFSFEDWKDKFWPKEVFEPASGREAEVKNGKIIVGGMPFPAIDGDAKHERGISDPVLADGRYQMEGFERVLQMDDNKNTWIMAMDEQYILQKGWPTRIAYYFFRENLKKQEPQPDETVSRKRYDAAREFLVDAQKEIADLKQQLGMASNGLESYKFLSETALNRERTLLRHIEKYEKELAELKRKGDVLWPTVEEFIKKYEEFENSNSSYEDDFSQLLQWLKSRLQ